MQKDKEERGLNFMSSHYSLGLNLDFSSSLSQPTVAFSTHSSPYSVVAAPPSFGGHQYHLLGPDQVLSPAIRSFEQLQASIVRTPTFRMPEPQPFDSRSFVSDSLKLVVKESTLALVKPFERIEKTANLAMKLKTEVSNSEKEGYSSLEAFTCQALRLGAHEISADAIKGAVVAGIPLYVAAAVGNPYMAATVPAIARELPKAYKGADIAAQFIGNSVEFMCHHGFELSRSLSRKEGHGN
jgi:hypothetical protein